MTSPVASPPVLLVPALSVVSRLRTGARAEAATGSGQIAQSITGGSRAAESTTSGIADSHAASSELARMAAELQTVVGQFRS